jgi:pimeloyl-ACP methyl ester carboxylesterase
MATIRAGALDIGYDEQGSGPPLVLLHGATSTGREDFAAQVPLLSQRFRVLLPDARGHARTRWDARRGFEYGWLVDDLEAFLDALGLPSCHLLGFSMGAFTALGLAARWPARVRTLVVIGAGVGREPRASVARRLMDPARIEARDPTWAGQLGRRHDAGQGPGAWRYLLPAIAADAARQPPPEPRVLRAVDAPTLVVVGDRDPFAPVDQAWALARQLPDSRLFVVPGAGHEAQVRRPALVNEALAGFYRATETAAAERATAATEPGAYRPRPVDPAHGAGHGSVAREVVAGQVGAVTDAGWLGDSPQGASVGDTGDPREEAT